MCTSLESYAVIVNTGSISRFWHLWCPGLSRFPGRNTVYSGFLLYGDAL